MKRILRGVISAVALVACSRSDDAVTRTPDTVATPPAVVPAGGAPAPTGAPASAPATPLDSIRGTIGLVGSDPSAEVTITHGDTVVVVRSTGIATLRRAAGLDVVIRGRRTSERTFTASPRGSAIFEAVSFSVRAAQDEPAVDGVLDIQHGMFFLTTPEGTRVNVPSLPVPLRAEIGSRIYLVGSLSGGVTAFGILAERQ